MPVALWRSGGWAAVLSLTYNPPDPELGEPASRHRQPELPLDRSRLEMADGSGGTNWFPGLQIRRPPHIGPRNVIAIYHGSYATSGWASAVLDGVAGTEAQTVELDQGGHRYQEALDSPIGAWVVALDGPSLPRCVSGRTRESCTKNECYRRSSSAIASASSERVRLDDDRIAAAGQPYAAATNARPGLPGCPLGGRGVGEVDELVGHFGAVPQ